MLGCGVGCAQGPMAVLRSVRWGWAVDWPGDWAGPANCHQGWAVTPPTWTELQPYGEPQGVHHMAVASTAL